ncbi:MAG: MBL fold metallo-hydrolase [Anaerolineae bacterium]|nr:MBL fold metallo-hydrolase [Anaerolineae bacterium]
MKITVVYDNRALAPNLAPAWGFSCLVGNDLLFDTGGDGHRLLSNMGTMGIDPLRIEKVVLSHAHGDHTGGLGGLLSRDARPTVYIPHSFPQGFKVEVSALTTLVEVAGPMEIQPGIHSTGELGTGLVEQVLVVATVRGLIVITGCAHPGIVEIVRRAKEVGGGAATADLAIVMGGFHLGSASKRQLERIIADFRDLGVQKVAPCHCTGDRAMQTFAKAYGNDFIHTGVGRVITVGAA